MIDLYASIELRDGRSRRPCVTKLGSTSDALEIAQYFQEMGVAGLHIVDLDAKAGRPSRSRVVIAAIASRTDVPVQVDSGADTKKATEAMLDTDSDRVVVGAGVLEEPGLIEWFGLKYPERVVVCLDAASSGVIGAAERLSNAGVGLLCLQYGNLDQLKTLGLILDATTLGVVAIVDDNATSDVEDLAELQTSAGRQLDGIVIGAGLYAGPGRVTGALEICS